MNITKREKTLIIFVLILALCCAYYLYFFKPNADQIATLSTSMDSKNNDLANSQQMQSVISQLDKEISDDQEKVVKYGSGITEGFDQPSILVYLQETVSKYADKDNYQFSHLNPIGQLEVCSVSVTIVCTYDNLKKLMSDLDNGKYLVKFNSLNIEKKIEDTDTNTPQPSPAPSEKSSKSKTTKTTAAPSPSASAVQENLLEITLGLEFYNYAGDVAPDTSYPFVTSTTQYGGDIFN